MSEAIGLMEGAFFVSRGDLLQWVNKTFKLSLTKIEQLGTGAVYCQILDAIHPGKVPLAKINWKSKHEWEFVQNFKILQQCFLKLKMKKHIEVERLIKAKYQDNLEFAQWMKRYYDLNKASSNDYDPEARRGAIEPDFSFAEKPTPKREREKSVAPAEAIFRVKDMQSLSPTARKGGRINGSNLLERKQNAFDDRDSASELKKLYDNLVEVKRTVKSYQKGTAEEKLKLISEIVNSTLKSKLFGRERRNTETGNAIVEAQNE